MKKLLSLILCSILIFTIIPVTIVNVSAYYDTGKCGKNVTYSFDSSTGILTFSGTGIIESKYASPFSDFTVKNVIIENGISGIGDEIFSYCEELTSITMPNSLKTIGKYAFENCKSLATITIPNSVTSIGKWAFRDCYVLKSIIIGNHIKNIDECAFYNCESLKTVNIADIASWCKIKFNDNVSNPLYYAKKLCLNGKKIIELKIPNNVKNIGNYTFHSYKPLTSIKFGNSVKSIGEWAFCNCTSIKKIKFGKKIKSIKRSAFYNCKSLKSITIPSSLNSIGDYAFEYCKSLKKVKITDLKSWCKIKFRDNPLYYAKNLYLNEKKVIKLKIPNSVTNINDYAFNGCTSIKSVKFGKKVKKIGAAFESCKSLKSVKIGKKVKTISAYAFFNCKSFKSVTIPKNVKNISYEALGYYGYEMKVKGFTIKGKKGTAAEKYANKNGFKFIKI